MARSRRRRVAALVGLATLLAVPSAADSGLIVESFVLGSVTVADGLDVVDPGSGPELVITTTEAFAAGSHNGTAAVDGRLELGRRGLAAPSATPWVDPSQPNRRCFVVPVDQLGDAAEPVGDPAPDGPPADDVAVPTPVELRLDTSAEIAAGRMDASGHGLRAHLGTGVALPHWRPDGVGSADTTVWVELPDLPTSDTPEAERTVCLTWGAPGLADVSAPIDLPSTADGALRRWTWLGLTPTSLTAVDWASPPDEIDVSDGARRSETACDRCATELIGTWTPTADATIRLALTASTVGELAVSTTGAAADLTTVVSLSAATPIDDWSAATQQSAAFDVVAGQPVLIRVRQRDDASLLTDPEGGPTLEHAAVAMIVIASAPEAEPDASAGSETTDPDTSGADGDGEPAPDAPADPDAAGSDPTDPDTIDPDATDPDATDPDAGADTGEPTPDEPTSPEPPAESAPALLEPSTLADLEAVAGRWTERRWLDLDPVALGARDAEVPPSTTSTISGPSVASDHCAWCEVRIDGWYVVPDTGIHRFRITGTEATRLLISTTGSPVDAVQIASTAGAATGDPPVAPAATSDPLEFVAGQMIWLRAETRGGGAGPTLGLSVQAPGIEEFVELRTDRLSSVQPDVAATLTAVGGPTEGRRATEGTWISPVYDLVDAAGRYGVVRVVSALPGDTTVAVRIATSETPDGPWAFVGPDTGLAHGAGSSLANALHDGRRHVRVQVELVNPNPDDLTPTVDEVGVRTDIDTVGLGLGHGSEIVVATDDAGAVDRVVLELDDLPSLDLGAELRLVDAAGGGAISTAEVRLAGATGSVLVTDGLVVAGATGLAPVPVGRSSTVRLDAEVGADMVLDLEWIGTDDVGGFTIVHDLRVVIDHPGS